VPENTTLRLAINAVYPGQSGATCVGRRHSSSSFILRCTDDGWQSVRWGRSGGMVSGVVIAHA